MLSHVDTSKKDVLNPILSYYFPMLQPFGSLLLQIEVHCSGNVLRRSQEECGPIFLLLVQHQKLRPTLLPSFEDKLHSEPGFSTVASPIASKRYRSRHWHLYVSCNWQAEKKLAHAPQGPTYFGHLLKLHVGLSSVSKNCGNPGGNPIKNQRSPSCKSVLVWIWVTGKTPVVDPFTFAKGPQELPESESELEVLIQTCSRNQSGG